MIIGLRSKDLRDSKKMTTTFFVYVSTIYLIFIVSSLLYFLVMIFAGIKLSLIISYLVTILNLFLFIGIIIALRFTYLHAPEKITSTFLIYFLIFYLFFISFSYFGILLGGITMAIKISCYWCLVIFF
jgi:hypothetical protein